MKKTIFCLISLVSFSSFGEIFASSAFALEERPQCSHFFESATNITQPRNIILEVFEDLLSVDLNHDDTSKILRALAFFESSTAGKLALRNGDITAQKALENLKNSYLVTEGNLNLSKYNKSTLWQLLDSSKSSGQDIINFLSSYNPLLKKLFAGDSNTEAGPIEDHTLAVYDVLFEQYPEYQRHFKMRPIPNVRLFQTLKFIIALHDIGKPLAIEENENYKKRQYIYNLPILEKALVEFGFTEIEIRFAKALVGNSSMGDIARGFIDAKDAKIILQTAADSAGMLLTDFAPIQFLYYTSDAASYPFLRFRIFTQQDELLLLADSQYENIWDEINKPHK